MNDKREDIIQGYRRWLDKYRWNWLATLKVTSGSPSERRAKALFDNWVSELQIGEGGDNFRWFRVLERGAGGNNIHFHALIGGLQRRCTVWERRWSELGGQAVITPYDPQQNGILYLLKDTGSDGDLNCDFSFPQTNELRDDAVRLLERIKRVPTTVKVDCINGDTTTTAELKRLFKPFGRILEVAIVESRVDRGRTLITATLTLQDMEAAKAAVRQLDGFVVRGLGIRVSVMGNTD